MRFEPTFVPLLAPALDALAEPSTKAWWERYLRGEARFRAVRMAATRSVVGDLVARLSLRDAGASTFLAIAAGCFAQPYSEDKLAGVLLLAEHGLSTLELGDVDRLAAPLADGSPADWNVCDWYCVKVLGPFIIGGSDAESRTRAIAAWRSAPGLWQRRAAAVALVDHAGTEPELFAGSPISCWRCVPPRRRTTRAGARPCLPVPAGIRSHLHPGSRRCGSHTYGPVCRAHRALRAGRSCALGARPVRETRPRPASGGCCASCPPAICGWSSDSSPTTRS